MKYLELHRAQPIGEQDTALRITIASPVREKSLDAGGERARFEGVELEHALRQSLPGGTYDQLLIAMLQFRRSQLVVAHDPARRSVPTGKVKDGHIMMTGQTGIPLPPRFPIQQRIDDDTEHAERQR
jgi:hypothetical protein